MNGPLGRFIDTMFVVGVVGGTGTTLVSGAPMLSEAVCELLGLARTFSVDAAVIIVWTAIFTVTVGLGLKRGIKVLSDINLYAVFVLCGIVFLVGPTWYMLNALTDSIGLLLNNFIRMSFYTAPHFTREAYQAFLTGESNHYTLMFPQTWTVFYWAWYIAYAPCVGIFTARISRGRTFREIVFTAQIAGSLGSAVFFGIFGNNAMHQYLTGHYDFLVVAAEHGENAAIIGALMHVTDIDALALAILVLFVFVGFIFTATTVDSSAYSIASVASKDMTKGTDVEPHLMNRLTWAVLLGAIALALMYQDEIVKHSALAAAAGGGEAVVQTAELGASSMLQALKVSSLTVAIPIMICVFISILSFLKWIKEDEPHLEKSTRPEGNE